VGNAIAAREEFGAANRHESFRTKSHGIKTRPMTIAMADRKVHMLGDEVDLLDRRRDAEVDHWVGRSKASKSVHEPLGAEIR
jgi:hypothetical protein